MAFGQSSGPPASHTQLRELQELLEESGHSDFRDARGPMGFTQRQAGGKFTGPEAAEFIEQLQTELHGDGPPPGSRPSSAAKPPKTTAKAAPRKTAPRKIAAKRPAASKAGKTALSDVPAEELAAELQRRGWIVAEP